jgi:hypothetical protein
MKAFLFRQIQQWKASLKEVVNVALREGLAGLAKAPRPRPQFRTQGLNLGRRYLPNLHKISEVLAIAEGEDYK